MSRRQRLRADRRGSAPGTFSDGHQPIDALERGGHALGLLLAPSPAQTTFAPTETWPYLLPVDQHAPFGHGIGQK